MFLLACGPARQGEDIQARDCRPHRCLALAAGDLDVGAFGGDLLLIGDPAGVGDGVTGEHAYVG
jgi:hypothetical protein